MFNMKASCMAVLLGLSTLAVAAPPQQFAPGRLIIQGNPGMSADDLDNVIAQHGAKRLGAIGRSGAHVISVPAGNEKAIAALLKQHPEIKSVEVDQKIKASFIPSDPEFGNQWYLNKIGAPQAWDMSQGCNIIVAVADSGLDPNHPDFVGQTVPGYNFYDNNTDTSDVEGHGTAVAGTIAAATNNGQGIASTAGCAKIMPLRISDTQGYAYWSTLANAIYYAADHGAKVVNASYAAGGSSTVQQAAAYLKSKGGLMVVSAGNTGAVDTSTPTTSMIVVSATDENDNMTSWSTYGSIVSLSAPGNNIETTNRGGGYGWWYGTSFSSPIVAGVVADMMAANPTLPNTQIEQLLYSTAVDLGAPGRDQYYGYGRVNAQAAVAAAQTAVFSDTTPPTVSITSPYSGQSVSGIVTINVNATDNVGVTRVDLMINNQVVGTDTSAPYTFSWNSTMLPNGSYPMVAVAYDGAGNKTTSATVTLKDANTTTTTNNTRKKR